MPVFGQPETINEFLSKYLKDSLEDKVNLPQELEKLEVAYIKRLPFHSGPSKGVVGGESFDDIYEVKISFDNKNYRYRFSVTAKSKNEKTITLSKLMKNRNVIELAIWIDSEKIFYQKRLLKRGQIRR